MPREQVEWFQKESVHDNDKMHARQSCTYYSIVNVNKANYPFLSSYEQEQTWILTRTMSNNHKRYQSSIENIHLTMPNSLLKLKFNDYENIKIENDRSSLLLPIQTNSSMIQKEQNIVPIKTTITKNNCNSNTKKSRSSIKPMRIIHSNDEFIVRI